MAATIELIAAVAAATAAVAALQHIAPAAGLGIVYLLAVMAVAIRRGELAALSAAVLSVLTLNYLFITPRHRLTIAHSQDVVELAVLLIAAVVVARLAAFARQRAAEAENRAQLAAAREREAKLLAATAAAILARGTLAEQLEMIGSRVAAAAGGESARVGFGSLSSAEVTERSVSLPSRHGGAWLHVRGRASVDLDLLQRAAPALGDLLDVAIERERVADAVAEREAARRAEIAKTAILHAISHDLRSPLTAVATAAAALRSKGVSRTERLELLAAVEAETHRLSRLVDDLLDLSKIEAGALAPQPDWCDLNDVAATAAAHFKHAERIDLRLPADLPLVRADAAQLERVFSNLIENAIKFSPPGSPVEITGGSSTGWVTVRVIDHGRGIPRKDRRRVFEPFFRSHAGNTSGSGLGLAICRGFVEANGGRISLQSGGGSRTSVAVTFPAPDHLGPSDLAAAPPAALTGPAG